MKYIVVSVLIVQIFVQIQGNDIPSDWKTCKQNDANINACLKDAIASALRSLMTGNGKFNIRPLDPLHVNNVTLSLNSPDVKANITFIDSDVFNFIKNSRVENVETDWKTMSIKVIIPKGLYAVSHCHIPRGSSFMGQPIYGDGSCEFHYGESVMIWRLKFGDKLVNDVSYYNVEDFNFQIETEKMTYKLKNLFNNDSVETEKMEKLINDDWKVFWNAMRIGVMNVLKQVGRLSSNKIFDVVPKNEITPL